MFDLRGRIVNIIGSKQEYTIYIWKESSSDVLYMKGTSGGYGTIAKGTNYVYTNLAGCGANNKSHLQLVNCIARPRGMDAS